MSDTPRTDSEHHHVFGNSEWVTTDFARTLERELTSARAEIARLKEALQRIRFYPVHSEPVGSAYGMQDIAKDALDRAEKGEV